MVGYMGSTSVHSSIHFLYTYKLMSATLGYKPLWFEDTLLMKESMEELLAGCCVSFKDCMNLQVCQDP